MHSSVQTNLAQSEISKKNCNYNILIRAFKTQSPAEHKPAHNIRNYINCKMYVLQLIVMLQSQYSLCAVRHPLTPSASACSSVSTAAYLPDNGRTVPIDTLALVALKPLYLYDMHIISILCE